MLRVGLGEGKDSVAKLFKLKAALQLVAAVAVSPGFIPASAAPVKQAPAVSIAAAMLAKAQQGDASAQAKLGLMYDDGTGVTQDYAAAAI